MNIIESNLNNAAEAYVELEASYGNDTSVFRVSAPHRESNCIYYLFYNDANVLCAMAGIYDGYHIETLIKRKDCKDIYGSDILKFLIQHGAKSLDTFIGNEVHYDNSRIHFKRVSIEGFNPEYLDKSRPVVEDYVVMVLEDYVHLLSGQNTKDNYATLEELACLFGNAKVNAFA